MKTRDERKWERQRHESELCRLATSLSYSLAPRKDVNIEEEEDDKIHARADWNKERMQRIRNCDRFISIGATRDRWTKFKFQGRLNSIILCE